MLLRRGHGLGDLPAVDVYVARERAQRGDRDNAIPLMRAAIDHLFREGQLLAWGTPATSLLVEKHCSIGETTMTWPKPRPR